ncbi:polysaccharide deacetylase family protein [Streptomyces silvisoli]|uniref:Polysaccharide deacetylase family protein n=1 Tax=Streptomyces silvisoli TaxID=3034235 RepID=A0ABT5ZKP0_9ACTN|nr:polysaccharide deacetylase family protein [Streptomyces silvisoli]MDF3289553.1 polysaccharide deacetylase family protein [Streptomyces silvisoli]
MSVSRRTVLAVMAGGVLAGCGTARNTAASASPTPTATPSAELTPSVAQPAVPTRADEVARYGRLAPTKWGLDGVPGMVSRLPAGHRATALTFDACGGRGGSEYDSGLIECLRAHKVPATLFINSRWIDENRATFDHLAADPLFEIANHGTRHLPLSVSGRSAYGIPGTRSAGEVYDEVAGNREKLTKLLGHPPRYFRSGTAYCDDVAARIVSDLGERFISFDVNGDGGATFTPQQVHQAVLTARHGSIVISHMNHPRGGTARGYATAIPRLLESGHQFVRLSDALT